VVIHTSYIFSGQNILFGGDVDPKDHYIAPTILTNVDVNSKVMQEVILSSYTGIVCKYQSAPNSGNLRSCSSGSFC